MYRHILVGLDGSAAGRQALEAALELAKSSNATVTVISVEEKLPAYASTVGEVEETRQQMESYFHRLQQSALFRAKQVGVSLQGVILAGNAAQIISRYAGREGFDLIVLGASGHESTASHTGATADRVVDLATCSVLVVRKGAANVRVREVMTRGVKTVAPDTPLSQVVELLWQEGVKAVPVLDEKQHVAGIITGGDLLTRGGLDLRLSLKRAMTTAEIAAQLHKLEQSGKVAADVMTSNVVTVNENAKLSEVTSLLASRQIKRAPVVDDQGLLAGIISRIDVLRQIAAMGGLEAQAEAPPGLVRVVRDAMSKQVPTVTASASLDEVAALLVSSPYRRVVVLDDVGRVKGLISDHELLDRVQPYVRPNLIAILARRVRPGAAEANSMPQLRGGDAGEVMINPVVTVPEDAPVIEAIRLMVERSIKRLPVVDAIGNFVGMVDRQNLLHALVNEARATTE